MCFMDAESTSTSCIRELFTRHNLRCTKQRLALYEALRKSISHPTADQLFQMVKPHVSGMSRATVYNTLEALCRAGLARKLPSTSGCCRYDADTSDHLHVKLRDTTEIRDVPPALGDRLLQNLPKDVLAEIEQHMGIKIEGITIQLTGRSRS